LQEFVGVFKEILELVALCAESLRGQLRGHLNTGNGRVFRNVTNLIDLNACFTGKRGFQLFGE
jgi:hypothetical protein